MQLDKVVDDVIAFPIRCSRGTNLKTFQGVNNVIVILDGAYENILDLMTLKQIIGRSNRVFGIQAGRILYKSSGAAFQIKPWDKLSGK